VSSDVAASVRRVITGLKLINDGHQRFVVSTDGRPTIHTRMQTLFNLRFKHELDRSLYELVMMHALAAEKVGPGGFTCCLEMLLEKLDGAVTVDTPRRNLSALPRHATSADVTSTVARYSAQGSALTSAILNRALHLAGFGGRVIVEKTTSSQPSVELVRGYTFELQQLLPFDVSFIKPRIACVDGYVENVSEIHHLLEAAAEAKEPCVIFLRGLSDDVKHTLKVNYDRGSLRVVPIGVRFDLDGMNTLVDLSVVTGADLVSSLKGDLISAIRFEELPIVDQLTVFRGRAVVTVTRTRERVAQHVTELRTRRAAHDVDDVARLLDKRIKSLSPNHVVIRLPDDKDFVTNSQAIDYALRAVKSIIDHGVTAAGQPVTTELAAQVHADRCFRTLSTVGAYLQ
jgi:hypothetical protein